MLIKFNREDVLNCQSTWDKYKTVGRDLACIKVCEYMYNQLIYPKPPILGKNFMSSLKLIFQTLGNAEDLKFLEGITAKNVIKDPYVQGLTKIDWQWKSMFWPVALKSYELMFAHPEIPGRTSGLTMEYLKIPKTDLSGRLVRFG